MAEKPCDMFKVACTSSRAQTAKCNTGETAGKRRRNAYTATSAKRTLNCTRRQSQRPGVKRAKLNIGQVVALMDNPLALNPHGPKLPCPVEDRQARRDPISSTC